MINHRAKKDFFAKFRALGAFKPIPFTARDCLVIVLNAFTEVTNGNRRQRCK